MTNVKLNSLSPCLKPYVRTFDPFPVRKIFIFSFRDESPNVFSNNQTIDGDSSPDVCRCLYDHESLPCVEEKQSSRAGDSSGKECREAQSIIKILDVSPLTKLCCDTRVDIKQFHLNWV